MNTLKEIELLKKGEDMETRFRISKEIQEVIQKSYDGEIALYGFIEEIKYILRDAKELLTLAHKE